MTYVLPKEETGGWLWDGPWGCPRRNTIVGKDDTHVNVVLDVTDGAIYLHDGNIGKEDHIGPIGVVLGLIPLSILSFTLSC